MDIARDRVSARIRFLPDMDRPGMLHTQLLRSPVAHARIVSIDTSQARSMPGVVTILTGDDILEMPGIRPRFGPVLLDQPILAMEKVRFVGEPVVAIVARDPDAALEASRAIDVDYEELPAVFDAREAMNPDAPLVHEGQAETGARLADVNVRGDAGTNLCNEFRLRRGDVELGFQQADEVFEDTFSGPPVAHVPLETHACIAEAFPNRVTVWSTNQIPFLLRAQLARIFGLPLSSVRVIVPPLGGAYGAKCYPSIEPVTAVLSLVTGRPVRLHLTREEEFVTITKHASEIRLQTGVTRDGRLVARKALCLLNTGAYADIGPRVAKVVGYGVTGPYAIDHVWSDARAVYTNLPPAGAFRGYGVSQISWAYETQMDMIADRLSLDPYAFRMKNLLKDGDAFSTGQPMSRSRFRELLSEAAVAINWAAEPQPRRGAIAVGKGLSCIIKGTVVPSRSTAVVSLNVDASLHVSTSTVEMGQGAHEALAAIASAAIGVPASCVTVSTVDTDVTPYDQQTSASRSTNAMGHAVLDAIGKIRGRLVARAASVYRIPEDDIELADGALTLRPGSEWTETIPLARFLSDAGLAAVAESGEFFTPGGLDSETGQGIASDEWHQASAGAEVAVDTETGQVEIRRYYGNVFAGRVAHHANARLQTEGNITFGIGQALFEEMLFDDGQLRTTNLGDYMIPSIKDLPADLEYAIVEDQDDDHYHGLGETTLPPVLPAIGNAIFQATGVRITAPPFTPEKVLRGLKELEASKARSQAGDSDD